MLLALSNDVSLRALGTRSWKSAQRWIYVAFDLTIVHGIAYQLVEKRHLALDHYFWKFDGFSTDYSVSRLCTYAKDYPQQASERGSGSF
jgi:DMSO/TMAO reductase YedYZ heme-binding membrane subunit